MVWRVILVLGRDGGFASGVLGGRVMGISLLGTIAESKVDGPLVSWICPVRGLQRFLYSISCCLSAES